jgi:Patatin-like phospholipase
MRIEILTSTTSLKMPTPSGSTTPAQPQSPTYSAIIDQPTDQIHSEPLSRTSSLPVPGRPGASHSPSLRPSSRISVPYSVASSHDDFHTGKTWARTVADDPWTPLILTLDGGGIRGYSSLLILKQLMTEVAKWENFYEAQEKPGHRLVYHEDQLQPCLYFDFMYGTSTGGLIATMLGRLRMTVPLCLEIYKGVGNELFGKKRSRVPLATKYDHEPLEKAVRDIVQKHCPIHNYPSTTVQGTETNPCSGTDWNPWFLELDLQQDAPDPLEEPFHPWTTNRICHSVCLTAIHNKNIINAYLLRTYNHVYSQDTPLFVTRYNEGAEKLRIWQVTRATSAAPFFFKSLVADLEDGLAREFKDGGIRENNPSVAAWSEFISLYGEDSEPALLLSVGTGRPNMERDGFASVWPGPFGRMPLVRKSAEVFAVLKNMLVRYTEGEGRHTDMTNLARGQHTWYKRLNVDAGMEGMRLDNWEASMEIDPVTKTRREVPGGKSLKRMENATELYLTRNAKASLAEYAAPKEMLKQIAQKMVLTRRARERTARFDAARWESFQGKNLRRRRASHQSNQSQSRQPNGAVAPPRASLDNESIPAMMSSAATGVVA